MSVSFLPRSDNAPSSARQELDSSNFEAIYTRLSSRGRAPGDSLFHRGVRRPAVGFLLAPPPSAERAQVKKLRAAKGAKAAIALAHRLAS